MAGERVKRRGRSGGGCTSAEALLALGKLVRQPFCEQVPVQVHVFRFRAKREHLTRFQRLSPGRRGQILAMTVLHVPYSLDIVPYRGPPGLGAARLPGLFRAGPGAGPLSSESGTYKTVTTRFWPWLSDKSPQNLLTCSLFGTIPGPSWPSGSSFVRPFSSGSRRKSTVERIRHT
jgi:hypothetical protein